MIKLLLAVAIAFPGFASAGEKGRFENLGVQITSLTLQGTTAAKDPSGRELICTVIRGEPAKLLVFDVRERKLVNRFALESAHGAWNATTATDGSVYVGTDDQGKLFRWLPGETEVHDLGQVAPDQTFIWDVSPGRDGEVFVGTYPGCGVFRYHPRDGSSDVSKGPSAAGENYARGLDFDPDSGRIFVGVGAHAHLIELDPKTAQKKDILPAEYATKKFAYSVDVRAGKLFVLMHDGPESFVMDIATHTVDAVIPDTSGQQVVSPKSPDDDKVYLNAGGNVTSYDLKTHAIARTKVPSLLGLHWVDFDEPDFPGATLVGLTGRGVLIRYNPRTGKSDSFKLTFPPESVPIQSICRGPDGKIYSGGYLVGGLSVFDPASGKHQQLGHISQPESMGVFGKKIFMGLYPGARLIAFDTDKPFDGKKNPAQFESLDRFDQDRPFATLGVEPLKKVFFGCVPDYGTLGGALAIYDVPSGKVSVHRNVVPDHGIVSLAFCNGLVVGGTTISGGLGIPPKAKEARLFLWDPATNDKVFETSPVPGAWLITGLMTAPDGNVWGVADGTLFVFDVREKKLVTTRQLFPVKANSSAARWRDAMLNLHPDGDVVGTMGGRLVRIDPRTMDVTVLREKEAGLLAIDDAGRIYFRDRANLWRYSP